MIFTRWYWGGSKIPYIPLFPRIPRTRSGQEGQFSKRILQTCKYSFTYVKGFERLMFDILTITWHGRRLSVFLSDFRKNQNTNCYFLTMLEKWRYKLDQRKILRVIFIDLSKRFDTFNHNLLAYQACPYNSRITMWKSTKKE